MSKKQFAQLINISYSHWRFVLLGERNLNLSKSRVVAHLLDTPVDVWQDPTLADQRRKAWGRYNSGRTGN